MAGPALNEITIILQLELGLGIIISSIFYPAPNFLTNLQINLDCPLLPSIINPCQKILTVQMGRHYRQDCTVSLTITYSLTNITQILILEPSPPLITFVQEVLRLESRLASLAGVLRCEGNDQPRRHPHN